MYRIKDTCVGCHYCALECPMGAVSYGRAKYEIDPEKCVECGLCAKQCPTGSIMDDSLTKPAAPHEPIERACDLVVCGGGTGLIAAVRAAEKGLKVIVLEKAEKVGGRRIADRKFNWVHPCSTYPLSDIEIEVFPMLED